MAEEGRRGLVERSRAPHSCPHQTPEAVAALIIAARQAHPDWGPPLLLDWLRPRQPKRRDWPTTSTAGAILKRAGLVLPRRRRRETTHPGVVDPVTALPNDLWTADFKGQFRTQDGIYCYPLTIADQHIRFLLTCHGLPSVHGALARPLFERTFREYGLPRAIRTDSSNAPLTPFVPNTVTNVRNRITTARRRAHTTPPHRDPIQPNCPRWNIPSTSS